MVAMLFFPEIPDGIEIVLGNLAILLRDLLPVPPLPTLAIRFFINARKALGYPHAYCRKLLHAFWLEGQLRERFLTHVREAAQNLHRYQEHTFLTARRRCSHTQYQAFQQNQELRRHLLAQDSRRRPSEAAVKVGRKRGCNWGRSRKGGMAGACANFGQISKMVINPKTPQVVWYPLPNEDGFASESHFCCGEKETLDAIVRRGIYDYSHGIEESWNLLLYPHLLKQEMDEHSWFQSMAADSGDETYMVRSLPSSSKWHQSSYSRSNSQTEDPYSGCFPHLDTSTSFIGTAAGVSGENAGRDFDPSHPQRNKGSVASEPLFLPNLRTQNTYTRGLGASYDERQFSAQTCDMTGHNQTDDYMDFPDGLPRHDWPSDLPVLGEPLEGASTSSFSSSVPSLATSEAMAAMTLDPMVVHGNTPGHLHADNSVASSGNHVNTWASPNYPSTIAPKMLRINPSPTPASSSESVHNTMLGGSDLDSSVSAYEHSHPRSPFHSQRQSQKTRKELPSRPVRSRLVPIVSSGQSSSSKGKRPALPQLSTGREPQSPQKLRAAQPKQEHHDAALQGSEGSPAHGRSIRGGGGVRSAKDEFLVRSKLAGMTYREIRREGNFTEAESTLRGRFRTLTKDKEARVRKPEWQDNDIRLLKKAVRKLAKGNDMMPAKAPWGQVAEYIMDHGGSYQFGGATCHRKWKELVEEGKAGPK
ncbi:hypothetical protein F4774DRAFT_416105 [Daldinia eschscholtzii]|nr:hypothetical protein F4774DRAFT_416105 [Daldinia eschscholtzii]